jgi:transcriptional regulator with XRE-family HTH domain
MGAFADNFKALLHQRGLTQIQASLQLGVTQATVCRWLNGQHEPSFAALMKIASRLDVPVEGFRKGRPARRGAVKEARAPYGATGPLESLKRRWKRADRAERKAIKAALARLFPGHQAALIAWLNAP